jgi:hypothetical protein
MVEAAMEGVIMVVIMGITVVNEVAVDSPLRLATATVVESVTAITLVAVMAATAVATGLVMLGRCIGPRFTHRFTVVDSMVAVMGAVVAAGGVELRLDGKPRSSIRNNVSTKNHCRKSAVVFCFNKGSSASRLAGLSGLSVIGNRFHHLGISFDGKNGHSLMCAIPTGSDNGKHLSPVREVEPEGKRAIGLKSNWFPGNGNTRFGVGRSMNDHVCVHVKPEALSVGVESATKPLKRRRVHWLE